MNNKRHERLVLFATNARIKYSNNKRHKRLVLLPRMLGSNFRIIRGISDLLFLPRMHESYGTCADEKKLELYTILSSTTHIYNKTCIYPYSCIRGNSFRIYFAQFAIRAFVAFLSASLLPNSLFVHSWHLVPHPFCQMSDLCFLPRMHQSYGTCADEIKIKLHTILSTTIPQPKTYQWQLYSGTSTKLSISKVQS